MDAEDDRSKAINPRARIGVSFLFYDHREIWRRLDFIQQRIYTLN
jgi:hypothetical protein